MDVSQNCKFGAVAGVGGLLALSASILLAFWSNIFDWALYQQLALSTTSYSYGFWEEIPVPMYFEFYLFNWTNPDDILNSDPDIRRPKLVETGPYVFREKRKKVILRWNDNNETITFLQNRTWDFVPELSAGSLDDQVTTLNVIAVAAAFIIRDSDPRLKGLMNIAMTLLDLKLSVTKTASQYLFEGYPDPLIIIGNILPDGMLPIKLPFKDRFGWFVNRDGIADYDGVFNMFTGKGNIERFGQMGEWNYENPTSIYESYCGHTNGSAGELFTPNPTKDAVTLFSTDICRSIKLTYKEEVDVDAIKGYRYWKDEHAFDNFTTRPDNWCFCPSGECPPRGAIDISSCKWNAPVFISSPHFLHADPYYSREVDGMRPNENIHQMFVDIEQRSGLPLNVEGAFQINLLLQPFSEYSMLLNVPKIYFPIFWFKQKIRIDDDLGKQIRLITRIPTAGYIIFGAILCIGVAMLVIASFYFLSWTRKRGRNEIDLKLVEAETGNYSSKF